MEMGECQWLRATQAGGEICTEALPGHSGNAVSSAHKVIHTSISLNAVDRSVAIEYGDENPQE